MSNPSPKRLKVSASPSRLPPDPKAILSWNANGLARRSKSSTNLAEFQRLIQTTRSPDLVCIQEAQLKRAPYSSSPGSHPDGKEISDIRPFLSLIKTLEYEPIWSLGSERRAGTLTLVHRRIHAGFDMGGCCAFTLEGALRGMISAYGLDSAKDLVGIIDTFAERCGADRCGDGSKSSSSGGGKAQSSLMSFMVKKAPKDKREQSAPTKTSPSKHDDEGRIQFLRFAGMDILNTYVPNNGKKEASFKRRRKWDFAVRSFLSIRAAILTKAKKSIRPIIWLGDLNVARNHLDGTHHQIDQRTGSVVEYWTDESKCFSKKQRPENFPGKTANDYGIPGFTANERSRFEETLRHASLVDAWRQLHPDGVTASNLPYLGPHGGTNESLWNRANFTWRGSPGEMAKYQGKGQRIDYFLVSEPLVEKIRSCHILGYGDQRDGFFCGSDHCPIILELDGGSNDNDRHTGNGEDKKLSSAVINDEDTAKKSDDPAKREVIDLT